MCKSPLLIVSIAILPLFAQAKSVDYDLIKQNSRVIKEIVIGEVYTLGDKFATTEAGLVHISREIPAPMIWANPRKRGSINFLGRVWVCAGRSDGTDGYEEGACNSVLAKALISK